MVGPFARARFTGALVIVLLEHSGKAAILFGHAAKRVAHNIEMRLLDIGHRALLGLARNHRLARRVAHFLQQIRHGKSARGDAGVAHGHLQRRHEHVALANHHVRHIARLPLAFLGRIAEVFLLPFGRRNNALCLVGKLNARLRA